MIKANVKDVVLAVTYRCNSRCRMCNIWQREDHTGELTVEDIKKLPISITDLNFTGGEPFLRTDILELVQAATEHLPSTQLIFSTNGFATDLIVETMKKVLQINPRAGVALSLDGVGEMHDQIRGIPGGYEKVIKTLRDLQGIGLKNIRLAFTMGDYNYLHLSKVYELANDLGVEMTLAVVHSSENFFGKQNTLTAKLEMIKSLDWLVERELKTFKFKHWLRAYFAFGMREYLRTGMRILPDYSGIDNWFIDPFGVIYPCDVATNKMGDLRSEVLEIQAQPDSACATSWMICTVRQAMRRHKWQVASWVVRNKIRSILTR